MSIRKKFLTFMFNEPISLPKPIIDLLEELDSEIIESDPGQVSGIKVPSEHICDDSFNTIATYLYIANSLKQEDAATIATLNDTSSMFPVFKKYGPVVLELIESNDY